MMMIRLSSVQYSTIVKLRLFQNRQFQSTMLCDTKFRWAQLSSDSSNKSKISDAVLMTGIRLNSTCPTNLVTKVISKRKRKSNYAKYTEFLEVTDKTINEKKSRIKHLKAKQLQEFVAQTEDIIQQIKIKRSKQIKLSNNRSVTTRRKSSKLPTSKTNSKHFEKYQQFNLNAKGISLVYDDNYDGRPYIFFPVENPLNVSADFLNDKQRIQNILNSFENYKYVVECSAYSNADPTSDSVEGAQAIFDTSDSSEQYILPDSNTNGPECKENPSTEELNIKKKSKRFKSKIYRNEELERLAKERCIRNNLSTYLKVSNIVGMLNRSLSTFLTYRRKFQSNPATKNVINIDLYNILLSGYARKASFDNILEILNLIDVDKLKYNEQTFAVIFECLAAYENQSSSANNFKLIEFYINKANSMNITLNDIMNKAKFIRNQRELVLNAIRKVSPDFQPIYELPIFSYNNSLLNELNECVILDENTLERCFQNSKRQPHQENAVLSQEKTDRVEMYQQKGREQLQVELDGFVTIKSIEKPKEFENTEYWRQKLKDMESQWRTQISEAIVRDMNILKTQLRYKPASYLSYYTYLKVLDVSHYVDIIINEIYNLAEGSEAFSPTVNQLHRELGQNVEQRFIVEQKKSDGILEKTINIYNLFCETWTQRTDTKKNTRKIWQHLVHYERVNGPSLDIREFPWPGNVLTGIGRFLYNILMRDVKIDAYVMRQNQKSKQSKYLPAFYTLFRNQGRLVKEEVKPHPVLAKLFRISKQQTLIFPSRFVPMLCPPQPWTTPYNGGFLLNNIDLIRLPHQAVQQMERIDSMPTQNLYPALDCLNQLASIPWRINQHMLDIIIEVFRNGGDSELNVPQPPSTLTPLNDFTNDNVILTNAERAQIFKEKLCYQRKQAEMYSLWCDTLYRLSLANHYRDKVFWLPHNMDFRGRVYPVPPHLNHMGSDLARSLLIFDESKMLGANGFDWLKLHCINLTGLKKRNSIAERLQYAEEVMPDILDSADNPLTGRKWWTKSDEPWQTLSCCIEISKVYRSDDPASFQSHFPIHQDGSCNGLQHYAALGRDLAGAKSVNLNALPTPQDVYSSVAVLVEKSRKLDAERGMKVAQMLEGYVQRKVIKQTVMTTVYGVTRYGARLQIARQLKDINGFPKDWVWPASMYLTTKTFESLREMFQSTREIQDWFTECARLISSVCVKNVEWITPLGLPVVQPYNRQEFKFAHRNENMRISDATSADMYERPNIMKQKNAFPPNFIHSLDSSHMMLTSLYCERKGLTFVSVHDCFWTHPITAPDMNKICREQFVALHSQPILENLSEFLQKEFGMDDDKLCSASNKVNASIYARCSLNRVLKNVPRRGDFDLNNVINSIYFFS